MQNRRHFPDVLARLSHGLDPVYVDAGLLRDWKRHFHFVNVLDVLLQQSRYGLVGIRGPRLLYRYHLNSGPRRHVRTGGISHREVESIRARRVERQQIEKGRGGLFALRTVREVRIDEKVSDRGRNRRMFEYTPVYHRPRGHPGRNQNRRDTDSEAVELETSIFVGIAIRMGWVEPRRRDVIVNSAVLVVHDEKRGRLPI